MGTDGSVERVLLLEPYGVASHRAWAEGFAWHSAFDVRTVMLPGERWRWRMRLGAIELARRAEMEIADGWRPDVVLVSSMVDVAAFVGLAPRSLREVPVVLYFHESQFAFPDPDVRGALRSTGAEFAATHVASMAAADAVVFNSSFHRGEAIAGVEALYASAPDMCPVDPGASAVVPVGVDAAAIGQLAARADASAPLILWSHRWDHDKNPQAFFGALRSVEDLEWRLAVVGENARSDPQEFEAAHRRFADRIVEWGHVPRDRYVGLLREADVVCSTAVHEYFGIAMIEAMIAGAVPLLPRRLSYPEVVPKSFHDAVLYEGRLGDRLRVVLEGLPDARRAVGGLPEALAARFDWPVVAEALDGLLAGAAASPGSP